MGDKNIRIDTRELIKQLGMFKGMTVRAGQKAQAKLTLALLKAQILGTPVDTGTLRGGWVASVTRPSTFIQPQLVRKKGSRRGTFGAEGRAHYEEAKGILADIVGRQRLGTRTYVSNNVRYVNHVNDFGAHAGFIESATENCLAAFGVEIDLS